MPTNTFASPVIIGSEEGGIAIGDVNGDGQSDIIVETSDPNGSNHVTVHLGHGDGSFASPAVYLDDGSNYTFVAAGDLNGDGRSDVVVPSASTAVLLADPDGTLGPPTAVPVAAAGAAIGDLNGDGKADVAFTAQGVSIFLGNGDGTLAPASQYDVGNQPFAIQISDVNGDGKPDLVVSVNSSNSIAVLLGDGTGAFPSQTDYSVFQGTGAPFGLAVADLNGDGKPDIVTTNQEGGSNEMAIMLNNGDGTYGTPTYVSVPDPGYGLGIADINGDGKPDLVVPSQTAGIETFLGIGDGTFNQGPVYSEAGGAFFLAMADFNHDGVPDLVADTSSGVAVMLGQRPAPVLPTLSFIGPVVDAASPMVPVAVAQTGGETGTLVFTDSSGHHVSLNINGDGKYLINLSTLNDGSINSTLTIADGSTVSGSPLTLVGTPLPQDAHVTVSPTSAGNLRKVGTDAPSVIDASQSNNVTFTTGNGPDTIVAGANDVVHMGSGPDTVVGAVGATLIAGSGPETLYGAPGETIVGGSGSDTFAFEPGFGQNTVSNFHTKNDFLQFNPTLLTSYAAMISAGDITQVGSDTIITDHAGDKVTLTGVAASSLTTNNFHFS